MTASTAFAYRSTAWGRLGKTLTNAFLVLMLAAFFTVLSGASAQAQSTRNICARLGFLENREDLGGEWKLSYSAGTTRYITRLGIQGNIGASVTEFYDGRLGRKRRIKQEHVLCQSKVGVVILGFRPTDLDTGASGSNLTYSADNFVISRQPDGKVVAFNRDDQGVLAELDIEFIREFDR